MTADQAIRLIDAVGQLLGVLVWPAVVLFFLLRFRSSLAEFFGNLGEFSLKAPGVEATAKRQREEAAAALGAAVTARAPGAGEPAAVSDPRDVAEALPSPRAQRRLRGAHALWVDDSPDNNRFERQALEALGIHFDLSDSTEDALDQVRRRSYDLVISDMDRPPDDQAGYALLDQLRSAGNRTPFIIYTGFRTQEHVREARQRGAVGLTNRPQELIEMVTQALTLSQRKRK